MTDDKKSQDLPFSEPGTHAPVPPAPLNQPLQPRSKKHPSLKARLFRLILSVLLRVRRIILGIIPLIPPAIRQRLKPTFGRALNLLLTAHTRYDVFQITRPHSATPRPQTLFDLPLNTSDGAGADISLSPTAIDDKLWGGFSTTALRDLQAMARSPALPAAQMATMFLAQWHVIDGDHAQARSYLELALKQKKNSSRLITDTLLASYSYVQSYNYTESLLLTARAMTIDPDNVNLRLAMANSLASVDGQPPSPDMDGSRLAWINKVYDGTEIKPLLKKDPSRPLTIDNLRVEIPPASEGQGEGRVTIVVPAYNAQDTLPMTLHGILAQTWADLEVIVVDDLSSDATSEIIQDFESRDNRIIGLRQDKNKGTYSARNRALEIATGDFITVHDSNDWSHPQKISTQARFLLNNPDKVANYSNMARVTENLIFLGKFKQKHRLVDWNPSSIMFRRSVLDKLGAWDAVRISADAEFLNRMRHFFPGAIHNTTHNDAPLSLALDQPSSLTATGLTHGRTTTHGIRREYREASNHWRQSADIEDLRLNTRPDQRPFPVPGPILPVRENVVVCDLLLVSDFDAGVDHLTHALAHIQNALAASLSVALFHWRHYQLDAKTPLSSVLRQLAQEGRVTIVAPGLTVETKKALVLAPTMLAHQIDLPPKVTANQVDVLLTQAPGPGPRTGVTYDVESVRASLRSMFGRTGRWHALSPAILDASRRGGAPEELSDKVWTSFIDVNACSKLSRSWNGGWDRVPALAFSGPGGPAFWPKSRKDLKNVICSRKACSRITFGAREYLGVSLGDVLPKCSDVQMDPLHPEKALQEADFLVHYPNEAHLEQVPRVHVLRAMAMGIPVITWPALKDLYGTGVLPAQPSNVWPVVSGLFKDEKAYREQGQRGQRHAAGFAIETTSP